MRQEILKIREKVDDFLADLRSLNRTLEEERIKKEQYEIFANDALEARAIIQSVSKSTQQLLEEKFNSLVTLAIQSVFQDDREFKIEFVEKRNKTEVQCYILKEGQRVDLHDGGGGQLDIVALACRFAFWNLDRSKRPLFFLDEPIKYLHAEHLQENCSEMLQMLSKKLGIQLVIISDQENLTADKTFEVINGEVHEK